MVCLFGAGFDVVSFAWFCFGAVGDVVVPLLLVALVRVFLYC